MTDTPIRVIDRRKERAEEEAREATEAPLAPTLDATIHQDGSTTTTPPRLRGKVAFREIRYVEAGVTCPHEGCDTVNITKHHEAVSALGEGKTLNIDCTKCGRPIEAKRDAIEIVNPVNATHARYLRRMAKKQGW